MATTEPARVHGPPADAPAPARVGLPTQHLADAPARGLAAWLRPLLLVAAVATAGAAAWWALPDGLRPDAVRDQFALLGGWGVPLFLLLFIVATMAILPTSPLCVAAGFLYGPWAGLGVAWAGSIAGGTAAFALGRIAQGPVHAFLRRSLRRTARLLDGHPFTMVLASRLLMAPHGPVSYAFGMSGIPARAFVTGSAAGMLPLIAALAVAGDFAATPWSSSGWGWAVLGAAAFLLAGGAWLGARWARGATA